MQIGITKKDQDDEGEDDGIEFDGGLNFGVLVTFPHSCTPHLRTVKPQHGEYPLQLVCILALTKKVEPGKRTQLSSGASWGQSKCVGQTLGGLHVCQTYPHSDVVVQFTLSGLRIHPLD